MTTNQVAVSIVLPAYNREKTIGAAIRSVLRQTYSDFELIVVDDGSQDGTVEAARAVQDSRIRVLALEENRGAGGARNAGIQAARAPWVAFQDSDDEWLPEKLSRQMARLAEGGFIAAYCGMAIVKATPSGRTKLAYLPRPETLHVEGEIAASLVRESFVSTQTLVARREEILAVGGFDESLPALEDWDLAMRLAQRGRFAFVDAPLVHQTFSENSITLSVRCRVEARERMLQKHRGDFASVPGLLALNARSIAGGWRRLGEQERARAALKEGLVADPFDYGLRMAQVALALSRWNQPPRET